MINKLLCAISIFFILKVSDSFALSLQQIASGFDAPVYITHANDNSDRLFVVEQGGLIKILKNGVVNDTPFLTITNLISTGGERGLLGLAFHPAFSSNGRFFIFYTDLRGDLIIARLQAAANTSAVDLSSRRTILRIPHRENANHNGGQIAFGPDGYLYIGTGDGGGGGDEPNNAQNRRKLLGKVLRIDIDKGSKYSIPSKNPFARSKTFRKEIYAYGLRNPYRFSFDKVSKRLFLGDVGQSRFEEINIIKSGGNYGWRITEGKACFNPESNCNKKGLVSPVATYDQSEGRAVIGGYVYRGTAISDLVGKYIFADYIAGTIWSLRQFGRTWQRSTLLQSRALVSSFGEDQKGELYVSDIGSGIIFKLIN